MVRQEILLLILVILQVQCLHRKRHLDCGKFGEQYTVENTEIGLYQGYLKGFNDGFEEKEQKAGLDSSISANFPDFYNGFLSGYNQGYEDGLNVYYDVNEASDFEEKRSKYQGYVDGVRDEANDEAKDEPDCNTDNSNACQIYKDSYQEATQNYDQQAICELTV